MARSKQNLLCFVNHKYCQQDKFEVKQVSSTVLVTVTVCDERAAGSGKITATAVVGGIRAIRKGSVQTMH